MKKKWITLAIAALMAVTGLTALLVNYKTDNLAVPVVCIAADENGNCTGIEKSFASKVDKVTFACQRKKPFITKATVTWYSDSNNNVPVKTETVAANSAGYFVSSYSRTEGMAAGNYHVYIDIAYALGRSKAVANFTVQ